MGITFIWIGLLFLFSNTLRIKRKVVIIGIITIILLININQLLGGLITTRIEEHVLDTEQGVGRVQMIKNWLAELGGRNAYFFFFGSGICTGADEATLSRINKILEIFNISKGVKFDCGWGREIHDNWFATHSLEVGVIGLMIYWLIFISIVIYHIPKIRKTWKEPERTMWTWIALGVLAIWPAGFVGAITHYMPITVYFFCLIALLDVSVKKIW